MFYERKTGSRRAKAELMRYGPNACLIKVTLQTEAPPIERQAPEVNREEYMQTLSKFLAKCVRTLEDVMLMCIGSPVLMYGAGKRYGTLDGMRTLADLDYRPDLDEAIDLLNKSMGLVKVVRENGTYRVEGKFNLRVAPRFVHGYAAGYLSVLTGKRIEVGKVDDAYRVRVYG